MCTHMSVRCKWIGYFRMKKILKACVVGELLREMMVLFGLFW